jgi:hypothetical protein
LIVSFLKSAGAVLRFFVSDFFTARTACNNWRARECKAMLILLSMDAFFFGASGWKPQFFWLCA